MKLKKLNSKGTAMSVISGAFGILILIYVSMLVVSSIENSVDTHTSIMVHNGTDITGAATMTLNYTVSSSASSRAGSLTVAYDNFTGSSTIAIGSTSIGTLSGTSPETFSIPASAISNGIVGITYTMAASENVTDTNFTYYQTALSEGLDSSYSNVQGNTASTFSVASIFPLLLIAVAVIGAFVGVAYLES